jgi:uncharacterized protein
MTTDPAGSGAALPASLPMQEATKPHWFRNVFTGPNGIRAGWRVLMFVGLFAGFQFLIVQRGLRLFPHFRELARQAQSGGLLTPEFAIVFEGAIIICAFLAALVMSRIEKRPFGAYGIPFADALGKRFWQGVIWGLVYESLVLLGIFALGGFTFGGLALGGGELVKFAAMWAVAFLFVGIFEEFLFRGYSQFTLGSGIGFWPSAFLMSALFGAGHLSNPGEGWVGALSVLVFGLFACLTLRRTGNLWFAIGFHAATDYAETFIYSVPDSGLLATGHLLNSSLHGPRWLAGGTIGPEGSVLDFVVMALAFVVFARMYPAKKTGQV